MLIRQNVNVIYFKYEEERKSEDKIHDDKYTLECDFCDLELNS